MANIFLRLRLAKFSAPASRPALLVICVVIEIALQFWGKFFLPGCMHDTVGVISLPDWTGLGNDMYVYAI